MGGSRIEREAEFHDQAFAQSTRQAAKKYYAGAARIKRFYHQLIEANAAGARALGIGVGLGGHAFELVDLGARVVGIDISEVGVENARARVAAAGLSERLEFHVMDAEALEFPDCSFDLVYGSGILHHLDVSKVAREICRVLKENGRGVFFEPLGHNPLINLYRRLTPKMRTEDEHPLRVEELELIAGHFASARMDYAGLLAILAAPLRPLPGGGIAHRALEALDRLLLKLPFLRRYAWIVVLQLERPRG